MTIGTELQFKILTIIAHKKDLHHLVFPESGRVADGRWRFRIIVKGCIDENSKLVGVEFDAHLRVVAGRQRFARP